MRRDQKLLTHGFSQSAAIATAAVEVANESTSYEWILSESFLWRLAKFI